MKNWTDPNQIFTQISLLNSKDKYWVKFWFRGQRSRSWVKHLFFESLVTYETLIIYQPNCHTGNMPLKQLKRVGQLFILELKVKVTGQTFHHSWNLNNFRKTEPISTKSSHKKHVYTTMKNSGPYIFLGSKVKVTGHTGLNFWKLHEFRKTEKISAESSHKEHANKMIEKQWVNHHFGVKGQGQIIENLIIFERLNRSQPNVHTWNVSTQQSKPVAQILFLVSKVKVTGQTLESLITFQKLNGF